MRILLDVCRERGKWLWAPVFFANQTGARRGEVLGIEWTEVDLAQRRVTFLQTLSWGQVKSTKADKIRKEIEAME